MLALGVSQSLGQVRHGVVQRQAAHRQLHLLGLLLLVLRRQLPRSPLVLLMLVHHVQGLHLAHPGVDDGVYLPFAAGEVARDIGDEVQPALLPVHIELHARRQRPDAGADGRHRRHRQLRSDRLDRVLHALRKALE